MRWWLLVLAVGCGPIVDPDAATGSGGADGGEDADGDESAEGSTGAVGDGDGDSGSEPGDVCVELPPAVDPLASGACEAYAVPPPPEPAPIEIRITNTSDEPISLFDLMNGCDHTPRFFRVTGKAFDRTSLSRSHDCPLDWTQPPCSVVVGSEGVSCLGCADEAAYLVVMPGATAVELWHPFLLNIAPLPPACQSDADAASCAMVDRDLAGELQFHFRAVSCPDCTCPGDTPSCALNEVPSGGFGTSEATVDYQRGCPFVEVALGA